LYDYFQLKTSFFGILGSASCLKALFLYFDNLADNSMSTFFNETMPIGSVQVGGYADIFSLTLSIVFAGKTFQSKINLIAILNFQLR